MEDELDGVEVVQDEVVIVDEDVKGGMRYKLTSMYSMMPWWSISTSKMRRVEPFLVQVKVQDLQIEDKEVDKV